MCVRAVCDIGQLNARKVFVGGVTRCLWRCWDCVFVGGMAVFGGIGAVCGSSFVYLGGGRDCSWVPVPRQVGDPLGK